MSSDAILEMLAFWVSLIASIIFFKKGNKVLGWISAAGIILLPIIIGLCFAAMGADISQDVNRPSISNVNISLQQLSLADGVVPTPSSVVDAPIQTTCVFPDNWGEVSGIFGDCNMEVVAKISNIQNTFSPQDGSGFLDHFEYCDTIIYRHYKTVKGDLYTYEKVVGVHTPNSESGEYRIPEDVYKEYKIAAASPCISVKDRLFGLSDDQISSYVLPSRNYHIGLEGELKSAYALPSASVSDIDIIEFENDIIDCYKHQIVFQLQQKPERTISTSFTMNDHPTQVIWSIYQSRITLTRDMKDSTGRIYNSFIISDNNQDGVPDIASFSNIFSKNDVLFNKYDLGNEYSSAVQTWRLGVLAFCKN